MSCSNELILSWLFYLLFPYTHHFFLKFWSAFMGLKFRNYSIAVESKEPKFLISFEAIFCSIFFNSCLFGLHRVFIGICTFVLTPSCIFSMHLAKWFFFFHSTHYLTGAPSAELLESPVTSMDHPFLKAFEGPSSSAQTISQIAGDKLVG